MRHTLECANTLRVQYNPLVATILCGSNPAETPTKIIDLIIDDVDARK